MPPAGAIDIPWIIEDAYLDFVVLSGFRRGKETE
jgi:hypothetical protein